MGLMADVVSSVETFVNVFVSVYWLVLLLYIVTSWIRLPYSPWLNRFQRFLYDVSEPYLRQFRRFMPNLGPLDLAPMVGMLALIVIDRVVIGLLELLH
jgi:YggT family protein